MPGLDSSYGIVVLVVLLMLYGSTKFVREYQRVVVFRFGKVIGQKGPGVVHLIPIIDRAVWVDVRERLTQIRFITCTTQDNESIAADLVVRSQILDATKTVLEVADVVSAIRGATAATLCSLVGGMTLGDALTQRASIGRDLRDAIGRAAASWGVAVTGVEIHDIRRAGTPSPLNGRTA